MKTTIPLDTIKLMVADKLGISILYNFDIDIIKFDNAGITFEIIEKNSSYDEDFCVKQALQEIGGLLGNGKKINAIKRLLALAPACIHYERVGPIGLTTAKQAIDDWHNFSTHLQTFEVFPIVDNVIDYSRKF